MKKIFVFLLFSSVLFSQQSVKNIFELKNDFDSFSESIEVASSQNSIIIEKSKGLAILYSLLLPGMGEFYLGDYGFGKYLTIADGVLWSAFAGFNLYGNWQENNYKSFASSYGEVNPENKSDEFYGNIGEYIDIDQYNRNRSLSGDFENMYDTNKEYWDWQSNDRRGEYRDMWVSSEQAYTNVRFAVGGLILNRIVSIINVFRISSSQKDQANIRDWNISAGYDQRLNEISLNFSSVMKLSF